METQQYVFIDQAEDRMWWFRAMHDNFLLALRRFLNGETGVLLDAGCGTGGLMKSIGSAFPKLSIVGVDIEARAAARAREKSGAFVAVGSVNNLPFADHAFLAMTSSDILYHKAVDPAAAAREAFRCLKPGGIFVVTVPAYEWLASAHDERVHGARRYSRRSLLPVLSGAGLDVVYSTYWNTLLFPLMVIRRKVFATSGGESDIKIFSPPIDFIFRAVTRVEHALLKAGLRFPFGGGLMAVGCKPAA